MRVVSSDFVKSVSKGVQTAFMTGFQHAEVQYPKVAMTINSTQKIETYAWLGQVSKPREWIDQRVARALTEFYQTVTNKKYEDTLVVEVDALEDEQYSQITPRAMSMGEAGRQYIDELIFTVMKDGFTTDCYDAQCFFDDDHSEGDSGTQSNLGSVALSGAGVTAGRAEMRQFKDDKGRYLDIVPDTLIVHPDEEGTAREILGSDRDPDNADNPVNINKGLYDLVVTPYLTSGYWVMARCKGYLKPFIWQDYIAIQFETSEARRFSDDVIDYGIRFRGRATTGDWRLAYGSHV